MNLKAGSAVHGGSVLFAPVEIKPTTTPNPASKADAKAKADAKGKAAGADGGAKATASKAKGKAAEPADPNQPLFSKLDIRVGKVVKAWHHPDADKLFVEEVDVGDP